MDRREFIRLSAVGMATTTFGFVRPARSFVKSPRISLVAAEGEHRFLSEQSEPTRVQQYNQSIPGPVIRLIQGQASLIEFHNQLKESTSVHWHGLRIDNAMDGVPGKTQEVIKPGGRFTYQFTPPDAGTYWYHTHQRSWEQLAKGLAGILIVEETSPPVVDQDLVFAIDDWRINNAMQIDTESLGALHDWAHGGRMGNFMTVNGEANKAFAVSKGERIRLRVLNIANSRIMNLRFNLPSISVIAIDGQPVTPYPLDNGQLVLAPGQRADLMMDMVLDPGHESPVELRVRDQSYDVAHFKFNDQVKREHLLDTPISLPDNPLNEIKLPDAFETFPLLMEGGAMGGMQQAIYNGQTLSINELIQHNQIWALNGIAGLAKQPLFRVKRGTAVKLNVENNNSWPHGIHLHGHHFIHDREPAVWRDTALFTRGEKGTLSFIADNPGKWLIHCHMIEHQAGGMVTWFEVV